MSDDHTVRAASLEARLSSVLMDIDDDDDDVILVSIDMTNEAAIPLGGLKAHILTSDGNKVESESGISSLGPGLTRNFAFEFPLEKGTWSFMVSGAGQSLTLGPYEADFTYEEEKGRVFGNAIGSNLFSGAFDSHLDIFGKTSEREIIDPSSVVLTSYSGENSSGGSIKISLGESKVETADSQDELRVPPWQQKKPIEPTPVETPSPSGDLLLYAAKTDSAAEMLLTAAPEVVESTPVEIITAATPPPLPPGPVNPPVESPSSTSPATPAAGPPAGPPSSPPAGPPSGPPAGPPSTPAAGPPAGPPSGPPVESPSSTSPATPAAGPPSGPPSEAPSTPPAGPPVESPSSTSPATPAAGPPSGPPSEAPSAAPTGPLSEDLGMKNINSESDLDNEGESPTSNNKFVIWFQEQSIFIYGGLLLLFILLNLMLSIFTSGSEKLSIPGSAGEERFAGWTDLILIITSGALFGWGICDHKIGRDLSNKILMFKDGGIKNLYALLGITGAFFLFIILNLKFALFSGGSEKISLPGSSGPAAFVGWLDLILLIALSGHLAFVARNLKLSKPVVVAHEA
jgi:hypothetical protein